MIHSRWICAGCCLSVGLSHHSAVLMCPGWLWPPAVATCIAQHAIPAPEMGLTLLSAPIGHRCEETPVSPRHPSLSHTHLVPSQGSGCLQSHHAGGGESFWGCSALPCHLQMGGCHPALRRAGDLSAVPADVRVSRARRLAEVDGELAAILRSHRLEQSPDPLHAPHEATAVQQRKLRCLAVVQQQKDAGWRIPQRMVRTGRVPGTTRAASGLTVPFIPAGLV